MGRPAGSKNKPKVELGDNGVSHHEVHDINKAPAEMTITAMEEEVKPETVFRRRVSTFLNDLQTKNKLIFFPIQQQTIVGDPDFFICGPHGQFIALELKIDGEEPRPLQQYKLANVGRMGGVWLVATPKHWSAMQQEIINMCRRLR